MMQRKAIAATLMSLGLVAMATNANATATWDFASKITVVGGAVDNHDGSWTYTFNLTNTDPSHIWGLGIYTGSQYTYDRIETLGLPHFGTMYTTGNMHNIPGQPEQYFSPFYNYDSFGNYSADFLSGSSGTLSFKTDGFVGNNLGYVYLTQGYSSPVESEHYTAFGVANVNPVPVPEPETYGMLLAGLGLVGVMARRRKVTDK